MDAFVIPACRLTKHERDRLAAMLTRPGSDFQQALAAGSQHGTICLCIEQSEMVGWARSEMWEGWPTLEAFVDPKHRGRGVASFCAAGLRASGVYAQSKGYCAVFRPEMQSVAARAGLHCVVWRRVGHEWFPWWGGRE